MQTPKIAPQMWRRILAEFVGTGLLVAIVVGSGIAASRLSSDDTGLQLLENSIATTLGLAVLILLFATVSGAHFNPVVSIADWVLGRGTADGFAARALVPYAAAQFTGAIGGALLANAMFDAPVGFATTQRATTGTLLAEVVATAGLVLLIFALARTGRGPLVIAPAVGAYIGAAYWFTSSTSFANPAVTVGRMFSDSFAGIAPGSVLPYVAAQLVGAAVGVLLVIALFPGSRAVRPS